MQTRIVAADDPATVGRLHVGEAAKWRQVARDGKIASQ